MRQRLNAYDRPWGCENRTRAGCVLCVYASVHQSAAVLVSGPFRYSIQCQGETPRYLT